MNSPIQVTALVSDHITESNAGVCAPLMRRSSARSRDSIVAGNNIMCFFCECKVIKLFSIFEICEKIIARGFRGFAQNKKLKIINKIIIIYLKHR